MNTNIHPAAIIEPGAKIGSNVVIEPYAVIKSNVTLEDGVVIKAHAYIDGYTTIGAGTTIYPFASIGTKTQALKYQGEKTFVVIGKHCEIREGVTINSSFEEGSTVSVGDRCLIMAYCHVAHHCTLESGVIMANGVNLAGHVYVEQDAVIGGMSAVHQFVRIGRKSMVGGMTPLTYDVVPFSLVAGIPPRVGGLNLVGLKRQGIPLSTRTALTQAFKIMYRSNLSLEEALKKIEAQIDPLAEINHFVQFCRQSRRGLTGFKNESAEREEELAKAEKEEEKESAALR
jgi:UDP-N-acetylglucosamine acyltransferase